MARQPQDSVRISRQTLLRAGGALGVLGLGVPGCNLLSTDPEYQNEETSRANADDMEAPGLARQVRSGDLPPVAERLPVEPPVVEPVERAGRYGGEWNTILQGSADSSWAYRTLFYDYLLRWDQNWKQMLPNLVERFEANTNGTEYTFVLRRGIKWSDGHPFTADDIVYAQNDVLRNTDIYPVPPWPGDAVKVDDLTVRIELEEPDGLFLQRQCTALGHHLVGHPRHYVEQFHAGHNPEASAMARAEGLDDWMALYAARTDPLRNVDLPVLSAWKFTTPADGGERAVAERNPYYWKVDPDGRQLPYIDKVIFDIVEDVQVMVTKAAAGEVDMHCRHFNTLTNKPVLAKWRERGAFEFFDLQSGSMNHTLIQLNLNHQDPVLRDMFGKKEFRIGLSHAIDRQEIIDAAFQKQGEPWQAAPRPESELFDEDMATQYIEYDVEMANRYLDQAGYARRDADGRRLRQDGEPIAFSLAFSAELRPEWAETARLLAKYWEAVGLTVRPQSLARTLWTDRVEANEHDVVIWQGDQGALNALATILEPFYFFPQNSGSRFAVRWAEWYLTGGTSGETPPPANRRQMRLYDKILSTTDQAEQLRLIKEILVIAKREFQVFGVGLEADGYGIVRNNFHNVPEKMIETYTVQTPGQTHPEQYFIRA